MNESRSILSSLYAKDEEKDAGVKKLDAGKNKNRKSLIKKKKKKGRRRKKYRVRSKILDDSADNVEKNIVNSKDSVKNILKVFLFDKRRFKIKIDNERLKSLILGYSKYQENLYLQSIQNFDNKQ